MFSTMTLKRLVLILAAYTLALVGAAVLFATPAHAQTRCIPSWDCPQGYEGLDIVRGPVGWHLWWFTRSPFTGKVYPSGVSCKHGVCDQGAFYAFLRDQKMLYLTDPAGAIANIEAKLTQLGALDCTVEKPLCDERAALIAKAKPEAERMWALKAVPIPPVMVLRVKPNPSAADGSRPVYSLSPEGVLGTKVLARAAKDTPCLIGFPMKTIPNTRDVYATPDGAPTGQVTLCYEKPQ